MIPTFNAADRSTWLELLTTDEVAQILREGKHGIVARCTTRTMVPAPHFRRPLRWRKSDVIRHIDGRESLRRVS